ncbi:hypothetical protein OAH12_01370 [Cyclobacteriaceae bacterium]|nr:hypothetical protein [Cyclobacteriaceae bacterium]
MKKSIIISSVLVAVIAVVSSFQSREIIVITRDNFEGQVELQAAKKFTSLDKVITYNHLTIVVEHNQGIHFIDMTNPQSPVKESFLQVPGCQDVAVKNGLILVRSAVDLVVFDLQTKLELHRQRNVFESDYDTGDVVIPEGSIVLRSSI